jgi:hypothetical protein
MTRAVDARIRKLEQRRRTDPLDCLTDEELQAKIDEVIAAAFPNGFDEAAARAAGLLEGSS